MWPAVTFYLRWVKTALWHSPGAIDLWAGIAGAVLGIIDHYVPARGLMTAFGWQVPIWAAGIVLIARFVAAPYWMAKKDGVLGTPRKRDVGVSEALAYAQFGEWGRKFEEAAVTPGNEAAAICSRFAQLAADDHIPVWGCRPHGHILEPIPPDFWRTHQLEWFSLLDNEDKTERAVVGAPHQIQYRSLMTSRTQIEEYWPPHKRKFGWFRRRAQ